MLARSVICLVALCALLFLACWLNTGTDERNMRNYFRYPNAVRRRIMADPRLAAMVPARRSKAAIFLADLAIFTVVLTVAGLLIRPRGFGETFLVLLCEGELLNLFDLLVIDGIWWRQTERVRLPGISNPDRYQDMRPHVEAFRRAIAMFALAALLASAACVALAG